MTNASPPAVGRDPELRAISAFLDGIDSGPAALVLAGSAGIGKTTLWLAGVREARERGHAVLLTRASESDARMSYAGLGDLVAEVPRSVFDQLPTPLRRSLDRALLRGDDVGGSPDPRAVSLAVGQVLRALAADRIVVLAIDDVQWLDRPSARVLSFVLRRLTDERIGVLEALRLGSGAPGDPIETERALPDCQRLSVGPMAVGAIGRMLRERTDSPLSRPAVVRLHQLTNGNPLFALEVARSAPADWTASTGPAERWDVPADIQRVLSARIARLLPDAQGPLLAIAATTQPTWDLVSVVIDGDERSLNALARAEEASVIERVSGHVRFTHPLLASTVYANATERDRREIHRRLAAVATDPEERARHLALATIGTDPAVALALEDAARHARTRGAADAAAELAGLASATTPADDEAGLRRRRLAEAEYNFDAGDAERARHLLRETIASTPPGAERAEMLYRLASTSWMNLIEGVREPSERGLVDAGDDPTASCAIHNALSWVAFYLADLPAAARHAWESARLEPNVTDVAVRSDAFATLAFVEFLEGKPSQGLMARGLELQDLSMQEASWTESSVYTTPGSIHGMELMWSGRLAEARAIFEAELALYEQGAMFALRQEVLCYLAELECRAGRWELAVGYSDESMDIIEESGQAATQSHVVLFNRAWPAALLGRVEEAREMATTGVRLAAANDDRFNEAWNHAVLGFLDLSLGALESALAHLQAAARWVEELGSVEVGIIPCLPDLVEALVGLGRIDEAAAIVARLEAAAAGRARPWTAGVAARGRAMLEAAEGDLDRAATHARASVAALEPAGQPFDTARSWLVLGQIERRAMRKRLARTALESARTTFVELGARRWTERAEAELARIGGRTRAGDDLTPTERRIAELVAEGKTNKEVAAILVVAERTVESALTQIYRKVDVRSRTELARRILGRD